MSVLIKDMEKPKSCYEVIDEEYEYCPFVNTDDDCVLLLRKGICEGTWADQYSKCPLVEEPEPCEDDPKADVYYLAEKIGIHRLYALVVALRGEPEMHHCCNCGRTVNNGGWYDDGRTRCPIEEHYQLPKDGYCHLWEKTKPWEDEYEHHSA